MAYIETVQDLIDLLNTIEDKSQSLSMQGIVGRDSNSRNKYEYFFRAELWDKEITGRGTVLVLE